MPTRERDFLELISNALEAGGPPALDRVRTAEDWERFRAALEQWIERMSLEWKQDEALVEDRGERAVVVPDDPRDYHW